MEKLPQNQEFMRGNLNNSAQDSLVIETKSDANLLRRRFELVQSILNNLPFNIAIVDEEGHIIAINSAWRKFAEENSSSSRDFMEYNYFELCNKAAAEGDLSASQALDGILGVIRGEITEYQQDYPCHSPTMQRWFRLHASVIKGKELLVVAHENITDLVIAQKQRKDSQVVLQKNAWLFDSMTDGYVCVAIDGKILEFNESYRAMLGYEKNELLVLTYQDLTPAKWHTFEADIVSDQVLRKGHSEMYCKEYKRKDGTIIPIELSTMLVRDDEGNPQFMWAIVRNLLERKSFKDSLVDLQKRIEGEHEALTRKQEALKEVLNHIETEKNQMKSKISTNIDKLIRPQIRHLQKLCATDTQQSRIIDLIKQALNEILSPFIETLSNKFVSLTPRELQVCNMVRDGMGSKEIADLLGISVLTVSTVRQQIRKKLGIENNGIGLAEYLISLK
jgi:PAS domain S-box-containing protein